MDFTTPGYYYWFLPLVMALYFYLLKGRRDQRVILLVAMSYLFFWMVFRFARYFDLYRLDCRSADLGFR